MKKILLISIASIFLITLFLFIINPSKDLNQSLQYDHPDKAQLREYRMTMDPKLGYPPVERLLVAKQYADGMRESNRSVSGIKWQERGPNNFGGRTRAIMFDPNDKSSKKVWAGGVTGGLWYNNDITSESSTWTAVDHFLSTLTINNLTYDPNNTNTFYFGTGEGWFGGGMLRGNGLWKSTDGGLTWSNITSTNSTEFGYIQKVVVTKQSTILIAARPSEAGTGGIYRSTDSGSTWNKVVPGFGADIEIVGGKIYASTGIFSEGILYKSTDDGVTFDIITPETGGQRIEIGANENHTNTVYAIASNGNEIKWFYRSDDSGTNWTKLTVPKYLNSSSCQEGTDDFTRGQAWYDLIIGVHPLDYKTIVVGGIDLHRSINGGVSWEPISYWTSSCEITVHADQHNFIFRPGYPHQALATNDGGVYYVSDIRVPKADGGPVFETRNNNYNVTQFYSCAMKNVAGSNYFLAGAQDNGSHQFTDYGQNATLEVTGGDGAFCFIDQNEPDLQITSYVYNNYYLTRDGWEDNGSVASFGSGDDNVSFINPSDYNSNTNTLYGAGLAGKYFEYQIKSTGVPTEVTVSPGIGTSLISAISVSPYADTVLFLGTEEGKVFRVNGLATTPTAIAIGSSSMAGNVSSVAVGDSNSRLMVTFSNYGVTSVWETLDGGTNWTSKEGNLPDLPVRWALYNPNDYNEALIATDLGVWSTTNLGAASVEWAPAVSGLANVRCDMIKYRSSDGLIAVATHGRGLFTSDVFSGTPRADFYPNLLAGYAGEAISFVNTSISATSYAWNFGDGGQSTEASPSHAFTAAGTYEVSLTINGDPATVTKKNVSILPKYALNYTAAQGGDFETNTTDFAAITVSGSGFELGSSTVSGKSGVNSGTKAWVLAPADEVYKKYSEAYVYTPSFDFSNSGSYAIEFYTKYELEAEWDGFIFQSSIDGGKTWSKVGDFLDETNWYNSTAIDFNGIFPPGKSFFSGSTIKAFVKKKVSVSNLSGNSSVAFRFQFKSDPASEEAGLVIDDFSVTGPAAGAAQVDFAIASTLTCIGEVIMVENSSSGSLQNYSWNFGEGAVPPTATGYGPFNISYATGGAKTVTLSAVSGTSPLTITKEVSISSLPDDIALAASTDAICAQESITVSLATTQTGASYQLLIDGEATGDAIVSADGEAIDFQTPVFELGTYSVDVKASQGACGRLMSGGVTLAVSEAPVVTISLRGLKLSTKYAGDSPVYQWLKNGEEITGATTSEYTVTSTGSYQLQVTDKGCSGTSTGITVTVLGLDDSSSFKIYPNPATDYLNYEVADGADISIYDLTGRLLLDQRNVSGEGRIKISVLEKGQYLLKVNSKGEVVTYKFVRR